MFTSKNRRNRFLVGLAVFAMALVVVNGLSTNTFAGKLADTTYGLSHQPTATAPAPKAAGSGPLIVNAGLVVNGDFETGSLSTSWATFTQGTSTIVTST